MIIKYINILLSAASITTTLAFVHRPTVPFTKYTTPTTTTTQLNEVIYALQEEDLIDEGQGGVALAENNALKIIGRVGTKKSSNPDDEEFVSGAEPTELKRYKAIKELSPADFESLAADAGTVVIGTGKGTELYKDPGTSTVKEIYYAPVEAAKDAIASLTSLSSLSDVQKVVFNFAGGKDLIIGEVMTGCDILYEGLELAGRKDLRVVFNAIGDNAFPKEVAAVTVVACQRKGGVDEGGVKGGEAYFHLGKWWTLDEEDINTDME